MGTQAPVLWEIGQFAGLPSASQMVTVLSAASWLQYVCAAMSCMFDG